MPEIDLGDGAEALISATEVAVQETNVTWKGVREAVQVLDAADTDAYFAAALRERLKKYERAQKFYVWFREISAPQIPCA